MESVEKKVVEIRKNLLRIMDLKKKMIDCEVSWLQMIRMLELTQYEAIKFKNGELPEAEKKDYYCESQEPRAETPGERTATAVRGENHAGVKNKKQNFFACYNMFF